MTMKSKVLFKKSKLMLGLVVLPALFSNAVHADITLNGFASIRGTSVSSDGGLEPFPGFEEGEITFNSESLFALQAQADLGEGLTATVQLFGEGKTDFDVEARWAYVSYQINDTHRVSGGRFANPLFHQSEYEKVGFAHNFSRLPKAVYIDFEFSTIEGIALDSQYNIGDYNLTTKVLYGGWDGEAFSAVTNNFVDFGLNNIFSANATLAGDWWQIFSGLMVAEIEGEGIDSSTVFPLAAKGISAALATGATNAQVEEFKSKLGWHTKDALYWFSGFAIDHNNWLLDFEFVDYVVKDSTDAPNQSWYLAVGRRFDEFLVTLHTEDYSQEADYAFLNGVDHPALLATGKGINDAFAQREFDGVGLAVRYDFHPSAALKVDYFTGTDTRAAVGDYQIWSIGIDLVF
jgi:hypothetical protein